MNLLKYFFIAVCLTTLCVPESTATGGNPDNPLPWVAMRPFPQFAMPEFESAYAYIPEGVLHPLRVLGLSTGCTNWKTHNHSGLKPDGIPDPALEQSVCALIDSLPSTFRSAFLTLDYCMYPLLTFIDQGKAHDKAFECMVDKVKNEYNATYYLLIGKQINPADASVEFRVALELPRSGAFSNMNTTLENGFRQKVLEAITNKYTTLQDLTDLPEAEKAGIDELARLIGLFLDGGFNGTLNEDLLKLNGFRVLPPNANPNYNTQFKNTTDTAFITDKVKDFARIKSYDPITEEFEFMASNAVTALNEFSSVYPLSCVSIFTDNSNYTTGISNDFEEANDLFDSQQQNLILWLHFLTSGDTLAPTKVYYKYKINVSDIQAENIVNQEHQNFSISTGSAAKPSGQNAVEKSMASCDIDLTWRAYDCLLYNPDVAGSGLPIESFMILPTYPPSPYLLVGNSEKLEMKSYIGGVSCGVLDGLIETIVFVYDLGTGLEKALDHVFGTPQWFFDTFLKIRKQGAFFKTIKAKFEEDVDYWWSVVDSILTFINFLTNDPLGILKSMVDEFLSWIEGALFLQGIKEAGYTHGKLIFDAILTFLTGGTSNVAKFSKKLLKNVIEAFTDSGGAKIRGLLKNVRSSMNGVEAIVCDLGQCFTKSTSVLTASGLHSIYEIKPSYDMIIESQTLIQSFRK